MVTLKRNLIFQKRKKGGKGGKVGIHAIEGNLSKETVRETKAKRTLTPPAQFQKLYESIESESGKKFLGLFDENYWNEINKGDILEIEADIQTPSLFSQIEQISGFSAFANLA